MKLLYTTNLTKQSMTEGEPWAFQVQEIPDNVRNIKADRQAWYMDPNTQHCFYSGFEGINPHGRIGKNNPAFMMRGMVFDVDHRFAESVIETKIGKLPFLPMWMEKSLGEGWHLVWLLDEPTRFPDDPGLAEASMAKLAKILKIDDWLGFDEGSWLTTSRLYANGGIWKKVAGSQPFRSNLVKSTILECALEEAKKTKVCPVPLDRIYEMLKAKFPSLEWPGDFELASQGPSFWIEGSTSTRSAIVHADGMYTFAAHSSKSKYFWDDILGKGSLQRDREERLRKAVKNFYSDGLTYFGPRPGLTGYKLLKVEVVRRMLAQEHGLSNRPPKKGDESSEIEQAMHLIESENSVDGAAPFIFRRAGPFFLDGRRYLNMIDQLPMKPSLTPTIWGPDGGFPFISNWLGRIFLDQKSLDHFLSWLHWFYHNALKGDPRSGHAIFMAGGPGIGKTLLSRYLIGKMVGGSADATRYLMDRDGFGGHLFEVPLWGVDDQGMTNSNFTIRQFTANVKRMIANKSHEFHNKYQRPVQILWDGRLFVTCNLDAWSMAVLPSLEDSIMDKVCFYRLIDNLTEGQILPAGFFPADVEKVIDGELAAFCRFIDDWVIPAEFVGDARYGIVYYQDEVMAQASFFNSGTSHFFEVIQIYMASYTKCMRKNVKEGTASDLLAEMTADEQCRHLVRGMNVTTFGRHLQNLSQFRPNLISSVINESGLRVWKITWNNEEPKQ